MMSKNNKPQNENISEDKVILAKRIASQSEKIQKRTRAVGNAIGRVLRWVSNWFDRIIFSSRHSKMVAFAISMIVYLAFNTSATTANINYSREFNNIPVVVNYNSELYEISGVPETVDVFISGDYTDISMAESNPDYQVTLDLSGLTEGTHNVKFTVQGFSQRLKTIVDPDSATVTIKLKDVKNMPLSYDFINQDKLGSQYVLGEPQFDVSEVTVKGAPDTLNKVALVKALIDVSGKTSEFTTEAPIVAYDQEGNRIDEVDIVPNKVEVTVDVSSPSKSVPLVPVFSGDIPDGKAVASIISSNDTITIYGQQAVLDSISSITVPIDAATLTEDKKIVYPIVLPTGVKSANLSSVTFDIKLGEGVTKTIDNVVITYRNHTSGYKLDVVDKEDVYTSVVLFGTQENLDKIEESNIQGYIDLRDIEPGNNIEVPVYVDSVSPLVSVKSIKETIVINVIE